VSTHRSSRNAILQTPPGPEGSNGSDRRVCRDVADEYLLCTYKDCLYLLITRFTLCSSYESKRNQLIMQSTTATSNIKQLKQRYIKPYSLNYKQLFKESWQLTKGAKRTFWLAILFYFLISTASQAIGFGLSLLKLPLVDFIYNAISNLGINYPLAAGLWVLAIQRATGNSIKASTLFSAINWYNIRHIFVICLWLLLLVLLVVIPAMGILIITHTFSPTGEILNYKLLFGIIILAAIIIFYFFMTYLMAIPLVASQRISGWHALTLSRLAINQHFFKVVLLCIIGIFILSVSGILTLGIAWIWLLPWVFIVNGKLFATLFSMPLNKI
jgi:hypothetical protein